MNRACLCLLPVIALAACGTGGSPQYSVEHAISPAAQVQNGAVRFDPPVLNFGVVTEDTCRPHKIAVINQSDGPIAAPAFRLDGESVFVMQNHFHDCQDPLPVGATCRAYINFCPRSGNTYHGTLAFAPTGDVTEMVGKGRVRWD